MMLSSSAALTDDDEPDFDPATGLSILRRAVAELPLSTSMSKAGLVSGRRSLERLFRVASELVGLVHESELSEHSPSVRKACSAARSDLAEVQLVVGQGSSRLALGAETLLEVRAKLHALLIELSMPIAATDLLGVVPGARGALALEQALAFRRLLADFHGSLLSTSAHQQPCASLEWALEAASAELAVLMQHPIFASATDAQQQALRSLSTRIERWLNGRRGRVTAAKLYSEVRATSQMLASLSLRPDVRKHDTRALSELSLLLSVGKPGLTLALQVADPLAAIRGLDLELDRHMLDLPLDPGPVLGRIAGRVARLCSRAMAS